MRFSFEPLSKEFSNRCVFDENAQLISVDGSSKRIEIHTYIHTYILYWLVPTGLFRVKCVHFKRKRIGVDGA